MNWNEIRKKAVEKGFELLKHGGKHDIYVNRQSGKNHLDRAALVARGASGLDAKIKKGNRVLIPVPCL